MQVLIGSRSFENLRVRRFDRRPSRNLFALDRTTASGSGGL
jgi:hypothetical protein